MSVSKAMFQARILRYLGWHHSSLVMLRIAIERLAVEKTPTVTQGKIPVMHRITRLKADGALTPKDRKLIGLALHRLNNAAHGGELKSRGKTYRSAFWAIGRLQEIGGGDNV